MRRTPLIVLALLAVGLAAPAAHARVMLVATGAPSATLLDVSSGGPARHARSPSRPTAPRPSS